MMRARLVALQRVLRHARPIRSSGRALAAPCLAVIVAAPGVAQPLYDGERVNKLSFVGVQQLSSSELGEVIVTEKRRCKSILFTPICLISNSGTFEAKPTLDLEELERDELRIRVHYWRAGYRRAEAEARVEPSGDGVAVTFHVDEGPPTVVQSVDVVQTDSVLDAGLIGRADPPRPGRPLDMTALDSTRLRLRALLQERAYADAEVLDSVIVSEDLDSARVRFVIEPGRRATIASVHVQGNEQVSERTILRLLDLRAGQLFQRSNILEAQRRLYRSELFRQALTTVPETADSAKPLTVSVREAPFRATRVGVGMNTLEFVQTEASYTFYNWYGTARRLELNAAVGNLLASTLHDKSLFGSSGGFGLDDEAEDVYLRPTWRVSAELTQPWLLSPRNSIALSIFASRRSVPDIVVDRGYGAAATFTRRLNNQASASLTWRYEQTRTEAGDLYFCVNFGICRQTMITVLNGSQRLSPLWLSVQADRTDDPLAPTRGWAGSLDAEHASAATASDFRYNRVTAEFAHHERLGAGVLAVRVRGGRVSGSASTAQAVGVSDATGAILHPRKRFYSGGSRSVRGYGENQLGPRILTIDPAALLAADTTASGCTEATIEAGTCDPNPAATDDFRARPLGGNSVIEASVEYRIPIGDVLTAAVFIDGASVGDTGLNVPPGARSAITPGFGVRYGSPIGPVRIDLGIRPTITERLPVVTQIVDENGVLQLVQLEQLREYDPIGPDGGFFRSIFSRLQLHLSIGEAF